MNSAMSRRRFLTETAVAAAGSTMVGSLIADLAPTPKAAAAEATGVDPNFVAGTVIRRLSTDAFSVRDIDGELRTIRMTSASGVWKLGRWNGGELMDGDCLYAIGEQESDGVLHLDRAWANISSSSAEVVETRRGRILLRGPSGRIWPVRVADITDIPTAGGTTQGDASTLPVGTAVQVIAYHEPTRSIPTASRVISLTSPGDHFPQIEEEEATAPDGTKVGLATWFCCEGINACGSGKITEEIKKKCEESGAGACGKNPTCKTNLKQIAWPKLTTGCGPVCDNCCVSSEFPRLACGHIVEVENPCNGKKDPELPVVDCGPAVRCKSPETCKERSGVKFDLTACAFAYLGSLSVGIIAANAKY